MKPFIKTKRTPLFSEEELQQQEREKNKSVFDPYQGGWGMTGMTYFSGITSHSGFSNGSGTACTAGTSGLHGSTGASGVAGSAGTSGPMLIYSNENGRYYGGVDPFIPEPPLPPVDKHTPNFNLLEDKRRYHFKLPVKSNKKWWEFWKKELSEKNINKLIEDAKVLTHKRDDQPRKKFNIHVGIVPQDENL